MVILFYGQVCNDTVTILHYLFFLHHSQIIVTYCFHMAQGLFTTMGKLLQYSILKAILKNDHVIAAIAVAYLNMNFVSTPECSIR